MSAAGRDAKLVTEAMPMVERSARKCAHRFPRVARDELCAVGREALLAALRDFDETHGTTFEDYAWLIVYRAMLRFAVRETRVAARLRATAFENSGELPPSEMSFEDAMDMTPEKARGRTVSWIADQAAVLLVSSVSIAAAEGPERALQVADHQDAVRRALATLSTEQRVFVERFYRDEVTIPVLANEMGVSERTVQRLHARVREHLAKEFTRREIDRA